MRRAVIVPLLCCTLFGCKDPEPDIVRYQAKRIEDTREKDRLLAVLVDEKDNTWSFRLSGPTSAVAKHEEKFQEMLKSVKFGEQPPVSWTSPKGWQQIPGDGMRFATVKTDDPPLEVTILSLPKDGGDVLKNVNRWRDQLSLPPANERNLTEMTKPIVVGDRPGTLVDLEGHFPLRKKAMPMAAPKVDPPVRKAPADAIKYDLPQGWAKVKPKNAMIREQFDVVDGADKAEATIVVLPAGGGGELANIDRWRDQIQLPRLKEPEELLKNFSRIDTAMGKAGLVDLDNPKAPGNNRIIGVIVPAEGVTYFLKLYGPSEFVGRQKARFEAFAKSFRAE